MGAVTSLVLGGIALAGAATSAAGQYQQGKAASKSMEYNAQVSEQQAAQIEQGAELDVMKQARNAKRMAGAQRAGYAASGVVGGTGTPLDVELESAAEAEMDMMITRWNGKVGASRAKSQAAYERMQGANYMSEGKSKATSTLLQGATQFGLSTFGGANPKAPQAVKS
jgi:hypothetical protein